MGGGGPYTGELIKTLFEFTCFFKLENVVDTS